MGVHVVTGANRGMGLEFTRQLLAAGHTVLGLCRDPDEADELDDVRDELEDGSLSGELIVRRGDVGDEESLKAAAAGIDKVDVLINNAGIIGQRETSLADLDLAKMAEVMDTNVYGIIRAIRVFLPALRNSGEKKIVSITSLMGSIADNGSGRYLAYRTSKAAVNMLTKNLAHELASEGFIVLALHPGWVNTDMGGPAAPTSAEDAVRDLITTVRIKGPSANGGFFDRTGKVLPY